MSQALVLYASTHGHTAKIAARELTGRARARVPCWLAVLRAAENDDRCKKGAEPCPTWPSRDHRYLHLDRSVPSIRI